MQTRVVVGQPWDVEADVLALPIPSDASLPAPVTEIDRRLDGALSAYRTVGELKGKPWSSAMLQGRETASPWILAMGVGEAAAFDRLTAVRLGGAIERRLTDRVVTRLAVLIPQALLGSLDVASAVELVTRGVVEGSAEPGAIYRDGFTSPPVLDVLTIVVEQGDVAALTAAAERGRIIGEGGNATRRLSQRSANDVSPEVLADEATDLARQHGLQIDILGPEQAEALGMGMFMAVGRGSSNTPRFIVIRNGAAGATDSKGRLLAMVGKGVCFDSGGISIKPADRMEEMKTDKTGACTVISAIATIKQLAPDLPIMAVAPAVENMPGPYSTRPGDVVKAMNGKTVEITNTDAEGRLILGDAFTWAERNGATHLVDVATLDRRRGARVRRPDHGWLRDPPVVVGRGRRGGGPPGRALLADPAHQRLPRGHGLALRRSPEQWHGGGIAHQERHVPGRVRDQAVGTPGHRRVGLLPQGASVGRAGRHGRQPRDARGAGARRRLSRALDRHRSALT